MFCMVEERFNFWNGSHDIPRNVTIACFVWSVNGPLRCFPNDGISSKQQQIPQLKLNSKYRSRSLSLSLSTSPSLSLSHTHTHTHIVALVLVSLMHV